MCARSGFRAEYLENAVKLETRYQWGHSVVLLRQTKFKTQLKAGSKLFDYYGINVDRYVACRCEPRTLNEDISFHPADEL